MMSWLCKGCEYYKNFICKIGIENCPIFLNVIKSINRKEVKKVSRPYFELEVIKIKKPKYQSREVIKFMGKKYEVFIKDGKVSIRRHKHFRSEGNWVNGENIDKIKFPVPCRFNHFKDGIQGVHGIGMINKTFGCGQIEYELVRIDYQQNDINSLCSTPSLKRLIELYDIHILKGKIIIYEEGK